MMYFKVFFMKYNVATTGNVMVCNMYMQTDVDKSIAITSHYFEHLKSYIKVLYGRQTRPDKACPPTIQNFF